MGFKSIDSEEKFGKATLQQGESPRHTHEGHENCAYYEVSYEEGPGTVWECEHGFVITHGAAYSEDYVRELKLAAQRLIAEIDYDGPPMHRRVETTIYIERLRELSR
jgi:hypothetical protein